MDEIDQTYRRTAWPSSWGPLRIGWRRRLVSVMLWLGKTVAYLIALFLLWTLAIHGFHLPGYLVPAPMAVLRSFQELPTYYMQNAWVTAQEAGLGIAIGFSAGFLLGVLIRYGGWVGRLLDPVIVASQVFPKEALAPLFLVFMGFGMAPKVVISSLICFFPVTVATAHGLKSAPPAFRQFMHVIGATGWQRFWRCDLPFAAPYALSSLRVCATLSVIGAVVGEFVGASQGLGAAVRSASADIGTDRVFAALLLLGVVGSAFYGTAVFIERVVFGRYTRVR